MKRSKSGRVMGWRSLTAAVAVLALVLVVAACGGDDDDTTTNAATTTSEEGGDDSVLGQSTDPIIIGQAKGFTGLLASFDTPPSVAAQFAVEDINAAGGIAGRNLEIVTADTKTKVENGQQATLDVIDEGANFIQAPCDFDFGAPVANEAASNDLVAMSDCAGAAQFGVQGIGPLAFTMGLSALNEGYLMAEWGVNERGLSNAYLLQDTVLEYHNQVTTGFEEGMAAVGGEIVGKDTFENGDPSIATQITRMQDAEFDFVFLASFPSGGAAAMKQIRDAGIDQPILTTNSFDGDFWKEAVPDISDVFYDNYGSLEGDDPTPLVNELVERYEAQEGSKPDNSNLLTGYAVVQAFQMAAEECDCLDGAGIAGALDTFDDVQLVDGALPTTFGPELHIDIDRPMRIMEIQDGVTTYLENYQASTPPTVAF